MLPLLKALLWDQAAARAAGLALITIGGLFYAQPNGRPWEERLLTAVLAGTTVGAASAPSSRSKELEDELAALRQRLDEIAPPLT